MLVDFYHARHLVQLPADHPVDGIQSGEAVCTARVLFSAMTYRYIEMASRRYLVGKLWQGGI